MDVILTNRELPLNGYRVSVLATKKCFGNRQWLRLYNVLNGINVTDLHYFNMVKVASFIMCVIPNLQNE